MAYAFLTDNNCAGLARSVPQCATLRTFGLDEKTADSEIFQLASERGLTLITQDDDDFVTLMRRAMHTSGRRNCAGEGYGLLVANSLTSLNFRDVTQRLRLGREKIDWDDVSIFNLKVSLGKGRDPIVSPLPRCKHCVAASNEMFGTRFKELGLDSVSLT